MSSELWTSVDKYIEDVLGLGDPALLSAQQAAEEAGLPAIAVSAAQGRLLEIVARMLGARRILEIGTLGGYSTIWMGRALPPGGSIVTIEIDEKHASVASSNFERAGFGDRIEVRVGSALEILPLLESEGAGPFDLTFIDADKVNIPSYFEWALKLSRPGAVIIVDNVIRDGAVIDSGSEDPSVKGVRRFNEVLAATSGTRSTILQTVGVKGYDGFAIVLVG